MNAQKQLLVGQRKLHYADREVSTVCGGRQRLVLGQHKIQKRLRNTEDTTLGIHLTPNPLKFSLPAVKGQAPISGMNTSAGSLELRDDRCDVVVLLLKTELPNTIYDCGQQSLTRQARYC
jgi:hypothetical protein